MCTFLYPMRRFNVVLAISAFFMTGTVGATDLLQAWQFSIQHDAEFSAAQAQAAAGATQHDQARSLWLPQVGLTATVGRMGTDTKVSGAQFDAPGFGATAPVDFNTSINSSSLQHYELGVSQPLLDRQRLAHSRQLKLGAESAGLQFLQAGQALMLRTVQHYFDVSLAQQELALLQAQYQSVQHTLQEAQDRFALGDIPITDTHEAAARAQTIKAQVLIADTQLQMKQLAYTHLTGQPASGLRQLRPESGTIPYQLAPLDHWLTQVNAHNLALQSQEKAQMAADEQAVGQSAWASPRVSLVGSASHDNASGNGRYGTARQKADNWMVGVQLQVPLFTGGYRSAKYREALHERDKTRAQGQHLRQQLEQQTRLSWLNLASGTAQVQALQQAKQASNERLLATRLGHSIGDKTTLELLDAENAVMAAQLALVRAQTMLVLERLQLAALAGKLSEADLIQANRELQ